MTQKPQKNKFLKNEASYLFTFKNDLLFLTYDLSHPKTIDIEEFSIGKIRLFKKDKVYSAELKSKPFLNPSLLWNSDTFDLLLQKFNQFVLEEDYLDFQEWLFVIVYLKIKGKQINMLKIRVNQEFGINPQVQLWNEFNNYNSFKAKKLSQTHKNIESLEGKIQIEMNRLQKIQQEQNFKVQEVKKKLSALMYEKEKKIMELTGNHLYKWNPDEQNQNTNLRVDSAQNNFISSQDDTIIMGSLFASSQDFLI